MWRSDVSVRRPVLATVLSALLVAFGALSFTNLPLRELPDVDPPIVSVETTYVGASAAVIESRDDVKRWEETGMTRLIVTPWNHGDEAVDGLRRLADQVFDRP